jgi:hypothetical protein
VSVESNSDVGRQLQLAIEFFDKVVPNQPGFSSSIAALTILPDVKRLSMAWKKWFRCAGEVRRLQFIRKRLQQLRDEQKLKTSDEDSQQNSNNVTSLSHPQSQGNQDLIGFGNSEGSKVATLEEDSIRRGSRDACIETDLSSPLHAAAIDVKQDSKMEMFLDEDEIEQMTVYYREYARRLVKTCSIQSQYILSCPF